MLSDVIPGTLDEPQRVLVTAGAGGVGLAVVERFHQSGACVHVLDISPEAVIRALADNPGLHGTAADVADAGEVESAINEALGWMGGIDVLVNCADDVGPRGDLEEVSIEDWQRVVSVNLSGMFYCARLVAPHMREQGDGVIINLASHAAVHGLPRRAAYAASKAGVLGLTKTLAREYGPYNVRCNTVLPGMLKNERGRELVKARARAGRLSLEAAEAELLQHVSMRTWIEASEVAEVVFFLCSDSARHVCGQTLGVCGHLEWE